MEVSGQLHAPAALPQGKRPGHPLERRLGGRQSRSGRGGEQKREHAVYLDLRNFARCRIRVGTK
jgi:hypothetical protein